MIYGNHKINVSYPKVRLKI